SRASARSGSMRCSASMFRVSANGCPECRATRGEPQATIWPRQGRTRPGPQGHPARPVERRILGLVEGSGTFEESLDPSVVAVDGDAGSYLEELLQAAGATPATERGADGVAVELT